MNSPVSGRLIGNRGGTWRGTVTEHGSLLPADGSTELDWFIAADDRWYTPRTEPTTRQKWYAGYPVAETRVKIPTIVCIHTSKSIYRFDIPFFIII
jgi:hypothetical protein